MVKNYDRLEKAVYGVPSDIDQSHRPAQAGSNGHPIDTLQPSSSNTSLRGKSGT
jgi:hypothetical protein